MKDFDIYLNKRPIECDVLVYTLPLRMSEIIAINKIVIDSVIENYILRKEAIGESNFAIGANVNGTYKEIHEQINSIVPLNASADLCTKYPIVPNPVSIILSQASPKQNNLHISSFYMISIRDSIQLTTDPVLAMVYRSIGRMQSGIDIDASIRGFTKTAMEHIVPLVPLGAELRTHKHGFTGVFSGVPINTNLKDLLYLVYAPDMEENRIVVDACVVDTIFCYSLGYAIAPISLIAKIAGNTSGIKYLTITGKTYLSANPCSITARSSVSAEFPMLLNAEATPVLKRYRLLSEMDADTLPGYDDMSLEDIYYIFF